MSSLKQLSPAKALRRFGFKQTLKGALILGIVGGLIVAVQGIGYVATYPDAKSRVQFATSLESAPGLGVIYGEPKNLVSPAGYLVYRTVPVMSLITAVWGLMTVTKLLRGQEEDGRLELIVANNTTKRSASGQLLLGWGASLLLAFGISTLLAFFINSTPSINASFETSVLLTLAVYLPAFLFGALGIVSSQLSITRRRAVLYGLIPLLLLFALRSIGNTIHDLYWLKKLTPFGWSDLSSPVIDPQSWWLLPFVVIGSLFAAIGIYLMSKRDLGEGLLHESESSKPRYALLGSPAALAIRQTFFQFVAWGAAALFVNILIAAIAGIAAQTLVGSSATALKGLMAQIGGSLDDIKIAFLSVGLIVTVVILLIMVTTSIGSIRASEAKNYLDNILTQPVRRSRWLLSRLLIIVGATLAITLTSGLSLWFVAGTQSITLQLGDVLAVSIALTGTVIFTLGLGVLLYGFIPRIATLGMYIVIGWSFLVDLLMSVFKLNDIVIKSSLLHYLPLSAVKSPDWSTFVWLVALGAGMAAVGTVTFTKRDIISE